VTWIAGSTVSSSDDAVTQAATQRSPTRFA
jgi:hypothetical protein